MARKDQDPKSRFAGQEPVSLGNDPLPTADALPVAPSSEEEDIEAADREAREHAEKLERERLERLTKPALPAAALTPITVPTDVKPTDSTGQALLLLAQTLATQNELLMQMAKNSQRAEERADEERAMRPIKYHELKPVTPWNPEGKRDRLKLTRQTLVSGYPANPALLTEEEIAGLNALRPGRYLNREVEVVQYNDGSINLLWPNRTVEQRMKWAAEAPNLVTLLTKIHADYNKKLQNPRMSEAVGDYQ
jgi:hypothetical protein